MQELDPGTFFVWQYHPNYDPVISRDFDRGDLVLMSLSPATVMLRVTAEEGDVESLLELMAGEECTVKLPRGTTDMVCSVHRGRVMLSLDGEVREKHHGGRNHRYISFSHVSD